MDPNILIDRWVKEEEMERIIRLGDVLAALKMLGSEVRGEVWTGDRENCEEVKTCIREPVKSQKPVR